MCVCVCSVARIFNDSSFSFVAFAPMHFMIDNESKFHIYKRVYGSVALSSTVPFRFSCSMLFIIQRSILACIRSAAYPHFMLWPLVFFFLFCFGYSSQI